MELVLQLPTHSLDSANTNYVARLFVGSEGTLGLITEVTVRLRRLPEVVRIAYIAFDSIHHLAHTRNPKQFKKI